MEEYGVLGIVVEVGICVGQDISGAGRLGRTYTLSLTTRKGMGACTSACLSDGCQLGSTDRQSGSHTRRRRGCMLSRQLRFGSRGLQCLLQCFRYRSD
jgi:hypothetical protein